MRHLFFNRSPFLLRITPFGYGVRITTNPLFSDRQGYHLKFGPVFVRFVRPESKTELFERQVRGSIQLLESYVERHFDEFKQCSGYEGSWRDFVIQSEGGE